jgi:hypothetical protein
MGGGEGRRNGKKIPWKGASEGQPPTEEQSSGQNMGKNHTTWYDLENSKK